MAGGSRILEGGVVNVLDEIYQLYSSTTRQKSVPIHHKQ